MTGTRVTLTISDPAVVACLLEAAVADQLSPAQWLEEHLRRWWRIPVATTPPL